VTATSDATMKMTSFSGDIGLKTKSEGGVKPDAVNAEKTYEW